MYDFDIVIVGSGPAGTAAALQLTNLNPGLRERILVLDKAVFPRPKLCAGGVTNTAEWILRELGLRADLDSLPVHVSKFILPDGILTLTQTEHFRVMRRIDFDLWLLLSVRERGIEVHDGEQAETIFFGKEGVKVRTTRGEYWTKMVIAADGANSILRRLVGFPRANRIMMALEVSPVEPGSIFNEGTVTALFDFTVIKSGIPGYCWSFPALNTSPARSFGIIEAPFSSTSRAALKEVFSLWLANQDINLNDYKLQAHPAMRYEPHAPCCLPRILFVGDAAGVDPLFGEGITSALGLGKIAAESAFEAIMIGDFSFSDYERRIRASQIGIMMRRRRLVARRLYSGVVINRRGLSFPDVLAWVSPDDPLGSGSITWEAS
jgi:menaquinone-9 beta-reductase